jgi:hypothetical protein
VAAILSKDLTLVKPRVTGYKAAWQTLGQLREDAWSSIGGAFTSAVFDITSVLPHPPRLMVEI